MKGKFSGMMERNRRNKSEYTAYMKAHPVFSGMTVMFIYGIMLMGIAIIGFVFSMWANLLDGMIVSGLCLAASATVFSLMGVLGEWFGKLGYKMEGLEDDAKE